jgi:hypothetical protein
MGRSDGEADGQTFSLNPKAPASHELAWCFETVRVGDYLHSTRARPERGYLLPA